MSETQFFPIGSYCSSTGWGGLEMNVSRFLCWMQQRGWPVSLYAAPETGIMSHATELGIPSRLFSRPSELTALWRSREFARMAEADGARVMLLHQSSDTLVCALAKRWSGRKLKLAFSQNMHLGNKRDLVHSWQYRQLEAFVSPLPILAKQAEQQTVVPVANIHVIPHGIELNQFVNRIDRTKARNALGLPSDAIIIGIIGRLDPKKGQHVGLNALARLHQHGTRAHLLIVGDSTLGAGERYRQQLQETVAQSGLTEFVHFRPYLEQPELAYGAMDIFALTSQSETYGLVTIEAMTSGLPVIGTDSGGTVDIIKPEHNGLLFPPDDDASLATALDRYINDHSFASRLAAQAKQDALSRFSHTQQCESWEKLLRQLVDGLQVETP